jgi:hypothetical protein
MPHARRTSGRCAPARARSAAACWAIPRVAAARSRSLRFSSRVACGSSKTPRPPSRAACASAPSGQARMGGSGSPDARSSRARSAPPRTPAKLTARTSTSPLGVVGLNGAGLPRPGGPGDRPRLGRGRGGRCAEGRLRSPRGPGPKWRTAAVQTPAAPDCRCRQASESCSAAPAVSAWSWCHQRDRCTGRRPRSAPAPQRG